VQLPHWIGGCLLVDDDRHTDNVWKKRSDDPVTPSASALFVMNYDNDENDDDDDDDDDWARGGRVAVEVCKTISFSPSSLFSSDEEISDPLGSASNYAKDAWLEYHWRKGGGLPIIVVIENKDDTDTTTTSNTTNIQ